MAFWTSDRCYFIAEIGVNHNGDVALAHKLIDVAAGAGADAVKFQTFQPKALATKHADKAAYQETNAPDLGTSQLDMLRGLCLTAEELVACRDHCQRAGIQFLSTPFDEGSADLLTEIGVQGFKVSSGDLTTLPFLAYLAQKGLPMIVSTGMGSLLEVAEAVDCIQATGGPDLALLHCVSNYPAAPETCNLRAMDTLRTAFNVPVGWSDHTLGDAITLAAVARGAEIIEKHFTLDTALPGPDHKASLTPDELSSLISKVRAVEVALGDGVKTPKPEERDTAAKARRSIVATADVPKGSLITAEMVGCKRPGTGIAPKHLELVIGRRAARDLSEDDVLAWTDFVL